VFVSSNMTVISFAFEFNKLLLTLTPQKLQFDSEHTNNFYPSLNHSKDVASSSALRVYALLVSYAA
jgi:hypothetical protein